MAGQRDRDGAGRTTRSQDQATGAGRVEVVRAPRVRIVVTGNELLPAGARPEGCRIVDSNGPMLGALVARDGGEVIFPGLTPDDPGQILSALRDDADVVLVSGGSSVGAEDHAPALLAQHGELAVHGVAMRPSSPAGMGLLDGRLVFLLPGNPVSCLCAYDFFAGRAIRALGGRKTEWPYRCVRRPLVRKLVSIVGRVDYADYLVIMTGRSDRHVHAIATGLEEAVRKQKLAPLSMEGLAAATWVLIDFGDVVVHVFQEDTRRLYDIEGLWIDAGRVPVPEETLPPGAQPAPRFDPS